MRLPNPHKEENMSVALMTLGVAAEGILPAPCPFLCPQDRCSERTGCVIFQGLGRNCPAPMVGMIRRLSTLRSGVRLKGNCVLHSLYCEF